MATAVAYGDVTPINGVVTKVRLSSLTDDTAVNVTHGGPAGCNPDFITYQVVTAATDNSATHLVRTTSSDDSSAGTANITFQGAVTGGGTASLTGLVVDVYFHFWNVKAGGIGS